ncbi:MAG TPA: twin-arginine translocase TatA/TatE family subunit [Candidatus Limnocylindrales bacterium]|jgi:TatA/E family protein of Tat protein translocase
MPFINGIGAPELIIILIIALIVVGPGRLPDVGSALGKSIREFRKAATDVKDATSLEDKPQSAPAPASVAPAAAPVIPVPTPALPAASTAIPAATAVAETAVADAVDRAPDISEMPDPQPVTDEQPTPTA